MVSGSTATPPAAPNPITATSTGFRLIAILLAVRLSHVAQVALHPGPVEMSDGAPGVLEKLNSGVKQKEDGFRHRNQRSFTFPFGVHEQCAVGHGDVIGGRHGGVFREGEL